MQETTLKNKNGESYKFRLNDGNVQVYAQGAFGMEWLDDTIYTLQQCGFEADATTDLFEVQIRRYYIDECIKVKETGKELDRGFVINTEEKCVEWHEPIENGEMYEYDFAEVEYLDGTPVVLEDAELIGEPLYPRDGIIEYIKSQIEEKGLNKGAIEIDFAGLCEEVDIYNAAEALGYKAEKSTGLGVYWIFKED